jgi:hypothetical protein
MGGFNKYSDGVEGQRKAEKNDLLRAERPSFAIRADCKTLKPSAFDVSDGETAHSPNDLKGAG